MDEQGHREAAARIIDPKVMRWAADLCLRAGPAEAARQYGPRRNRALAKADAILALSALPIQGGGWRPIEEAPRDGTAVLVTEGGISVPHVVRWIKYAGNTAGGYWHPRCGVPTCFQPLPAPPVPAEETK